MLYRLKSLELQGYKTFAIRTLFEFSGAITAIVGPNGSGKSNIADSIRWVLGEQSYSLLRGKKTEDMIFSGSDQRSRASMASASMVFDNSDGWLPIDFSEVEITRRAYRDGQNEYLINGQKVRLKDVSELLSKSGLAERTYTIIGQGLVDMALALRPEDRRRLFEEAAGIGLYRSRREESLRRLDATHHNLERVLDILSELEPRLKSLEKQAKRAIEFEQVRDDLKALLLEWYGYHWHRAQNELSELSEIVRHREVAYKQAREEELLVTEKISHTRNQLESFRNQLNENRHLLSNLFLERESISKELAVTDERFRSLSLLIDTLNNDKSRLLEGISLNEEVANVQAEELKRIEIDLAESQTQIASINQALESEQESRHLIEEEISHLQNQINGITHQKSELEANKAERVYQVQRYETTITERRALINKAGEEIKQIEFDQRKVTQKNQQMRDENDSLNRLLDDKTNRLHKIIETKNSLIEKQQHLSAKITESKAHLEVYRQAERALEGYSNGVKVINEAFNTKRLKGIYGYLGKFLEVPDRIQVAISALLGERINTVLLDQSNSIDEILDLLIEKGSRAVLVPLSPVKPELTPAQKHAIKGLIGLASDLVKNPPEIKKVVQILFGNAYIVEDRKSARKILPQLDSSACVVTLKGEVFYSNGTIIAGFEGQSTLLGRGDQIRRLEESIKKDEQSVNTIQQKIVDLSGKENQIVQEEQEIQHSIDDLEVEMEHLQSEEKKVHDHLDQLNNRINWYTEEITSITEELEKLKHTDLMQALSMEQLIDEIEHLKRQMLAHQQNLGKSNLDEYQDQIVHWNAVLRVAEKSHSDLLQRLEEKKAEKIKLEEQFELLNQRLGLTEKESETLRIQRAHFKEVEKEIASRIEALEKTVTPMDESLADYEQRIAGLIQEENLAKKRFAILDQQLSQSRINLARQQERFDSLQKRIEDDLGLVAFEYERSVSGPTPLPLAGMVEMIPKVAEISVDLEENIKEYRVQLRRIGSVNPEAKHEYEEVNQRYQFLNDQIADLEKAETDIRQAITELDVLMQQEFERTFEAVSGEFTNIFSRLFAGGSAKLVLTGSDDLSDTGVEIEARLPGRRIQGLSLLSGGEKSLTATALIFALLKISPTPFCLLDEVDAMLDEINVSRFRELLRELSRKTQFIVVTHNRNTVQVADVLYGVTMGKDSSSQVISLRLEDVENVI
jgi:chromosome segregation protein